ncbi:MAG: LamG domain-containing protein, partial [Chthoniobacteraceae bacterium]
MITSALRTTVVALSVSVASLVSFARGADARNYRELVLADAPTAYWRFDTIEECCTSSETDEALRANAGDKVSLLEAGPRPPAFPAFSETNTAADFTGYPRDTYLRVKDPGAKSVFDFENGETITMEAWVQCGKLVDGKNVYIVGKGRTGLPGNPADNQNWALRLRGQAGLACTSFVFHDRENAGEKGWHRWTSTSGFQPGEAWHHVVLSYKFGEPESVRGFINGEEVKGAWDMGGTTTTAPVVDNDEVWIGGSMGGTPSAQFPGRIDELAIYRVAIPATRIALHAARIGPVPTLLPVPAKLASKPGTKPAAKGEALPLPPAIIAAAELPKGKVRVQVFEFAKAADQETEFSSNDSPKKKKESADADESWSVLPAIRTDEFTERAFAFADLTNKYSGHGVKIDRSAPFLVRAAGVVRLPAGEYTLHLRAFTGTRVAFDGHIIAETPLKKPKGGDVEGVPDLAKLQLVTSMPLLPPG